MQYIREDVKGLTVHINMVHYVYEKGVNMGRTNVVLDDNVVKKAKHLTGIKTTKDVIHLALSELIRRKKQKKILTLAGKVRWEGDLDSSRQGRIH